MATELQAMGARLEEFLNDSYIQRAFKLFEDEVTAQWRRSVNPSEREQMWLKLKALDELQSALRGVVDSAKVEAHVAEVQEKRAAARKALRA